jgi:hypothetical protein
VTARRDRGLRTVRMTELNEGLARLVDDGLVIVAS